MAQLRMVMLRARWWAGRSLLLGLAWFLVAFAPLTCIVHCQILMAPGQAGHGAHAQRFDTAPTLTLASCHLFEPQRPATPSLPPMATLPRIVYDVVIPGALLLLLAMPAAFGAAAAISPPPRPFAQVATPPPRRAGLAAR